MEYSITSKNSYRVEFTTKPEGYQDFLRNEIPADDSPYRKGIPVKVDVIVEGVTGDLKDVPEVIMSHAVKDINVEIAATIRPMAGEGVFTKRYDTLKDKLKEPIKYVATLVKAKTAAKKKVSVVDSLLLSYGVQKVAKHLTEIFADMQVEGAEPKEILLKWATILEKENLK